MTTTRTRDAKQCYFISIIIEILEREYLIGGIGVKEQI